MFVLTHMSDNVRIVPWLFHLNPNDAIAEELNRRLANKVVINVGLCIALFDILKIEDSRILPGDGSFHTTVEFRYTVFRPFIDEVLIGKIRSCCQDGVYISMGFFDDILIPPNALQHPSRFDEAEQLWVWEYESEDKKHDMFMDLGEQIRFRVVAESFVDTSPDSPDVAERPEIEVKEKRMPYSLTGSISEPGLGLLKWWT
ncbi:DNA-directed RNA polymerase III subunit RPC8-like [Ornithodoros turicata]|uniref:DNA-directed RNA polymerase III subunit RPC8-like n=1 Tax=Ornithodoros turicata TaxID=34597 RepID=UPI00313867BE